MVKLRRLACSFCGKSDADVAKLVAGPRAYICDECVAVARRLMESGDAPPPPQARPGLSLRVLHRILPWERFEFRKSGFNRESFLAKLESELRRIEDFARAKAN